MSRSDITRRALASALAAELETRHLDRITVTDVARLCGLSRQAFYYHFHDVYDLAEWMYLQEAEAAIGNERDYDTWQQGLLAILTTLHDRHDFVTRTIHSIDPTHVNDFLRRNVSTLLLRVVNDECGNLTVAEPDRKLVADFYAAGFIAIVSTWVTDGMLEDPEALVERLALIVQGNVSTALARLADRDDAPTFTIT